MSQQKTGTKVWKTEVTINGEKVISVENTDAEISSSEAIDAYHEMYPQGTDAIIKISSRMI